MQRRTLTIGVVSECEDAAVGAVYHSLQHVTQRARAQLRLRTKTILPAAIFHNPLSNTANEKIEAK